MADSRDSKPPSRGAPGAPGGAGEAANAPSPAVQRGLRLIRGEGKRRDETLHSRDDVARLLLSSAADMLLKRISADRAHEIQARVDRIMRLFERAGRDKVSELLLRRELDDLEALWREGQKKR